jgi:hypothetical protein
MYGVLTRSCSTCTIRYTAANRCCGVTRNTAANCYARREKSIRLQTVAGNFTRVCERPLADLCCAAASNEKKLSAAAQQESPATCSQHELQYTHSTCNRAGAIPAWAVPQLTATPGKASTKRAAPTAVPSYAACTVLHLNDKQVLCASAAANKQGPFTLLAQDCNTTTRLCRRNTRLRHTNMACRSANVHGTAMSDTVGPPTATRTGADHTPKSNAHGKPHSCHQQLLTHNTNSMGLTPAPTHYFFFPPRSLLPNTSTTSGPML